MSILHQTSRDVALNPTNPGLPGGSSSNLESSTPRRRRSDLYRERGEEDTDAFCAMLNERERQRRENDRAAGEREAEILDAMIEEQRKGRAL